MCSSCLRIGRQSGVADRLDRAQVSCAPICQAHLLDRLSSPVTSLWTLTGKAQYSMVGHAIVISSTVQLHILLFSDDEDQVDAARRRLERNFLILCGLQNLWRTIDHSFGRFREFHEACMRAKANFEDPRSTFRLDRWMLRFLMEFSKPIEQRVETESPTKNHFEPRQHDLSEIDIGGREDLRRWTMEELGFDLENDQVWNPMLSLESWRTRTPSAG